MQVGVTAAVGDAIARGAVGFDTSIACIQHTLPISNFGRVGSLGDQTVNAGK
jgi:hypothetical protein